MLLLKVTPKAESDLVDTWLYTFETWSAEQADEYVDQLGGGMAHLTVHLYWESITAMSCPATENCVLSITMFFIEHLNRKF